MTFHDIFVGEIDDGKFSWGKNIKNNCEEDVPTRITQNLDGMRFELFSKVYNLSKKKGNKQVGVHMLRNYQNKRLKNL